MGGTGEATVTDILLVTAALALITIVLFWPQPTGMYGDYLRERGIPPPAPKVQVPPPRPADAPPPPRPQR